MAIFPSAYLIALVFLLVGVSAVPAPSSDNVAEPLQLALCLPQTLRHAKRAVDAKAVAQAAKAQWVEASEYLDLPYKKVEGLPTLAEVSLTSFVRSGDFELTSLMRLHLIALQYFGHALTNSSIAVATLFDEQQLSANDLRLSLSDYEKTSLIVTSMLRLTDVDLTYAFALPLAMQLQLKRRGVDVQSVTTFLHDDTMGVAAWCGAAVRDVLANVHAATRMPTAVREEMLATLARTVDEERYQEAQDAFRAMQLSPTASGDLTLEQRELIMWLAMLQQELIHYADLGAYYITMKSLSVYATMLSKTLKPEFADLGKNFVRQTAAQEAILDSRLGQQIKLSDMLLLASEYLLKESDDGFAWSPFLFYRSRDALHVLEDPQYHLMAIPPQFWTSIVERQFKESRQALRTHFWQTAQHLLMQHLPALRKKYSSVEDAIRHAAPAQPGKFHIKVVDDNGTYTCDNGWVQVCMTHLYAAKQDVARYIAESPAQKQQLDDLFNHEAKLLAYTLKDHESQHKKGMPPIKSEREFLVNLLRASVKQELGEAATSNPLIADAFLRILMNKIDAKKQEKAEREAEHRSKEEGRFQDITEEEEEAKETRLVKAKAKKLRQRQRRQEEKEAALAKEREEEKKKEALAERQDAAAAKEREEEKKKEALAERQRQDAAAAKEKEEKEKKEAIAERQRQDAAAAKEKEEKEKKEAAAQQFQMHLDKQRPPLPILDAALNQAWQTFPSTMKDLSTANDVLDQATLDVNGRSARLLQLQSALLHRLGKLMEDSLDRSASLTSPSVAWTQRFMTLHKSASSQWDRLYKGYLPTMDRWEAWEETLKHEKHLLRELEHQYRLLFQSSWSARNA